MGLHGTAGNFYAIILAKTYSIKYNTTLHDNENEMKSKGRNTL